MGMLRSAVKAEGKAFALGGTPLLFTENGESETATRLAEVDKRLVQAPYLRLLRRSLLLLLLEASLVHLHAHRVHPHLLPLEAHGRCATYIQHPHSQVNPSLKAPL
jgi:hypothetical protein